MKKLIALFVNRGIYADLLTIGIIIIGLMSAKKLHRDLFPNIEFDIITVSTVYPGASAKEVEKLITNPIEQEMQEVDGIRKLTSVSTQGRSLVVAELDPDQTTQKEGKDDIKDVIDRITNLPEDAEDPIVSAKESKQQPMVEVSVAGDMPELELRKIARWVEDEIELVPGVARIASVGMRDVEISVEANPDKLIRYHLSLEDIIRALERQNHSIPGGTIEVSEKEPGRPEKIVRTTGEFEDVEDIEKTVIRANDLGQPVRIRDVAIVTMILEKAEVLNRTNGIPSIGLTVLKKERADAITMVDAVAARLKELEENLDPRVKLSLVNDSSFFIRRRLDVLSTNLGVGLILVLLILTLILPFRVAVLVSIGIPFAFLGTFIVFGFYGISLNLLTLMGLIIVCGMLVDDAIVVTDNAYRHIEEGKTPIEAGIKGTQQIWGAVTASVLTTILAFLPLSFMGGIVGKFVSFIPLAVMIALGVSLIECFFVLPHHIGRFIRKPNKRSKKRLLDLTEHYWEKYAVPGYVSFLKILLKWRWGAALVMLGMIAATVYTAKKSRFILFPKSGVEIFFVRADAQTGTPLEKTRDLLQPIEKIVSQLPSEEMKYYVTRVGIQRQDANDPNSKRGNEFGQVVVFLTPAPDRSRSADQIIEDLRAQTASMAGEDKDLVRIFYDKARAGPPTGMALQIGVRGKDYDKIRRAADDVKAIAKKMKGVKDVQDNFVMGKKELHVEVNSAEAAAAGLDVSTIGRSVRSAFEGMVPTSIRKLDEEVEIRVSLPKSSRQTAKTLNKIYIPNPTGRLVPLVRVAGFSEDQNPAAYQHEANKRQILVTGNVVESETTSEEVNKKISDHFSDLRKKHPDVHFYVGGEAKDTKASQGDIGSAFGIALFLIFMVLVVTFNNFVQPFIIILTIPMGIMAVFWSFFLQGMTFTLLAMIGAVALAGVIVNNAIVFIVFINEKRSEGLGLKESIYEAGRVRLRPIFLTTITTALGIFPTAYGIGGLDPFVVPIAMALGWGVLGGSVLTTVFFPAAIAIADDFVVWFKKILKLISRKKEVEV